VLLHGRHCADVRAGARQGDCNADKHREPNGDRDCNDYRDRHVNADRVAHGHTYPNLDDIANTFYPPYAHIHRIAHSDGNAHRIPQRHGDGHTDTDAQSH
jgi:hypothetical protein